MIDLSFTLLKRSWGTYWRTIGSIVRTFANCTSGIYRAQTTWAQPGCQKDKNDMEKIRNISEKGINQTVIGFYGGSSFYGLIFTEVIKLHFSDHK